MSIRIKQWEFFVILFLIVFLKPANVILLPQIDAIYKLLKVLVSAVILVLLLTKKKKLDKTGGLCLLFVAVLSISIYLNCGSYGEHLQEIVSIVILLLFYKIEIQTQKKLDYLIMVICIITKIYIVLELVTIIMNKPLLAEIPLNGDPYFLGSDNYSAFIIIPLVTILTYDSFKKYNRLNAETCVFLLLGFMCFAITFSVAAMMAYLLFVFIILLIQYPSIRNFFRLKYVVLVSILFLIGVVFFNIQDKLGFLLASVGKIGLNSREYIWPMTVNAVMKRPFIGYGVLTEAQRGHYLLYGAGHAHNIVLEFLLSTGIVGTVIAFIWIKNSLKGLHRIKNKSMYVIQAGLTSYFICGMFDFYLELIYFWLFIFTIELIIYESQGKFNTEKV